MVYFIDSVAGRSDVIVIGLLYQSRELTPIR